MQLDFLKWSAVLRDGSTVSQDSGASVFHLRSQIAKLTLSHVQGNGTWSIDIPEYGQAVWFAYQRGAGVGFNPNRAYPGLFALVTSDPLRRVIAEKIKAWEHENPNGDSATVQRAITEEVCSGGMADLFLKQVSYGCLDVETPLRFQVFAFGYIAPFARKMLYISPTCETEETSGYEVTITEHGYTLEREPAILAKSAAQCVEAFREPLLTKIQRAKEEIESFEATLKAIA